MRLGIMQPYFLPYIGYWQLLNAVDEYIIYDDVNFIKGGWINRNRILVNGKPQYFNIQMKGASSFKTINEVQVDNMNRWREKRLLTLTMAYKKAPYFDSVYFLLERILNCQEERLSHYVANSIHEISAYLGIDTKLLMSSETDQNRNLHAQDRVLDICKRRGATQYYNAIGGQTLYSKEIFAQNGIELVFLQPHLKEYVQFAESFVSGLSIIDVMMFNSQEKIQEMLADYETI